MVSIFSHPERAALEDMAQAVAGAVAAVQAAAPAISRVELTEPLEVGGLLAPTVEALPPLPPPASAPPDPIEVGGLLAPTSPSLPPASAVSSAAFCSAGTVTSMELGTDVVASEFVSSDIDSVTASGFEVVQMEDYD